MKNVLLFLLIFIPLRMYAPLLGHTLPAELPLEERILTEPFSEELLKEALNLYVAHPDIALAQAKLETGHFTSPVFLENNNLFGMHPPKVRETLSVGSNRKCAVYLTWLDSVKDYALLQDYYFAKGRTIDYILKVYCPNKEYTNRVYKLMS